MSRDAASRDAAITRAMRELAVDEAYRPEVNELMEIPRARWPACCGGLCDPCVLTLAGVVSRARQLVGEPDV